MNNKYSSFAILLLSAIFATSCAPSLGENESKAIVMSNSQINYVRSVLAKVSEINYVYLKNDFDDYYHEQENYFDTNNVYLSIPNKTTLMVYYKFSNSANQTICYKGDKPYGSSPYQGNEEIVETIEENNSEFKARFSIDHKFIAVFSESVNGGELDYYSGIIKEETTTIKSCTLFLNQNTSINVSIYEKEFYLEQIDCIYLNTQTASSSTSGTLEFKGIIDGNRVSAKIGLVL